MGWFCNGKSVGESTNSPTFFLWKSDGRGLSPKSNLSVVRGRLWPNPFAEGFKASRGGGWKLEGVFLKAEKSGEATPT